MLADVVHRAWAERSSAAETSPSEEVWSGNPPRVDLLPGSMASILRQASLDRISAKAVSRNLRLEESEMEWTPL